MDRARVSVLTATSFLLLAGLSCSYSAHNYLGAWRDEHWIPHYMYKSGVVNMLAEPEPLAPWRGNPSEPYRVKPEDFAPDEVTRAAGPLRFEREQLKPVPGAYRFVHMADIQVRDRCVGLSQMLRQIAKLRTDSVEKSFYCDHGDVFYLAYILGAVRKGVDAGYFDAVVHGGDAVQLGIRSEIHAFDYFMENFLLGPSRENDCWLHGTMDVAGQDVREKSPVYLNTIGNHDRFFMGCFTRHFLMIRWRETDSPVETLDGTIQQLDKFVRDYSNEPNGLGIPPAILRQSRGGYYDYDRAWPGVGKVRLVMLNTNEANILDTLSEKAALYPALSSEQFAWLGARLEDAEKDPDIKAVLVFGHNQLGELLVNRYLPRAGEKTPFWRVGRDRAAEDDTFLEVATLIGNHPKVVGYICGHLHSGSPRVRWAEDVPAIRAALDRANDRAEKMRAEFDRRRKEKPLLSDFDDPRPTKRAIKRPFCEIINPSVQEYPKSYMVVTLTTEKATDGSGNVTLDAQYYNLNDLIPPTGAALFDKDVPLVVKGDDRAAILRWHKRLNELSAGRADARQYRSHLVAEYAMAGQYQDLHARESDSAPLYNESVRSDLVAIYRLADEFMPLLKNYEAQHVPQPEAWESIRAKLQEPPFVDVRSAGEL